MGRHFPAPESRRPAVRPGSERVIPPPRRRGPRAQARIGRSSGRAAWAERLWVVARGRRTLPRMGTAGSYVTWGVLQISVTNLVIILLMLAVFALAVLVPFGHRDRVDRR